VEKSPKLVSYQEMNVSNKFLEFIQQLEVFKETHRDLRFVKASILIDNGADPKFRSRAGNKIDEDFTDN
jgi:hypothetical protein